MRFKRYKGKRRGYRAKVVKMKFQSFVDISTQADNMQIISVNAGGANVINRLGPMFQAYKYYKLGGVSIKLIPASTLPVDPTGLSYESGENTVDPRDQLTPGMCRITNGEDILEDFTGLTGDQQRLLYDNMLLDPRWYKWMLQSGVKRYAKPKYWQIGQLHQDKWPGAVMNYPDLNNSKGIKGTVNTQILFKEEQGYGSTANGSSPLGLFQTGHRGVLGWMPTDSLQKLRGWDGTEYDNLEKAMDASVPTVELFKILTPPMHKTNYYYRMFITETVYFKDPVVMNVNGFRPIDVFHISNVPLPKMPTETYSFGAGDNYTGGNDGSD